MQIQFKKLFYRCLTAYCLLHTVYSYSQDEIDIVDPYQMKVSRSKQADTFYFIQKSVSTAENNIKSDTLRSYDVFLEERITPFGIAYMCNGKEVTKKKYFEYKQFWKAAGACKPCLLYTYDDNDKLKYVAYQFQDCLCGSYKEFYNDGNLKVEGQFKNIVIDNWDNFKNNNSCNIRDGIWIYYLENGVTEKTETYVDGKLKETFVPTITINSVKNSTENEAVSDEEPKQKNGLLKRLKDKNKETEDE